MNTLRAMIVRCRGWFRRGQIETEMKAELAAHFEGLVERNLAAGMSPAEAHRAARLEFGGVEQIAERARDERRSVWLEQTWQDLRYAMRSLAKSPSFTITAVLTLAFGIGVNAALFGLFNQVLLRPLPLHDPDRLVVIKGRIENGGIRGGFNYAEYLAYRDGNRSLEGVVAVAATEWSLQRQTDAGVDRAFDLSGLGTVPVEFVSDNYFRVLGGAIRLGRDFLPGEVSPLGPAPVIVLSHTFWESHFRRDPNVLGAKLTLDQREVTVIGVTAADFPGQAPIPPVGWLPLTLRSDLPTDYAADGRTLFRLIGRLQPGVTEPQAAADLGAIAAARAAEFPGENAKTSVLLEHSLRFVNIPRTPEALFVMSPLFLGFGMVLFIACANVANLLLARSISRQSEIGVRLTLGASRWRIVRQLLTENGLLCAAGGVLGLGLGFGVLHVVKQLLLAPVLEKTWLDFLTPVPDLRVLGFTALLTTGAALAAGLLPALQATRTNLIGTANPHGTVLGGRFTSNRMRQGLVVLQIALCLALLSCAGVFARNAYAARNFDVGFDPRATFGVGLSPASRTPDGSMPLGQMLDVVRTIPGVEAVSASSHAPTFEASYFTPIRSVGSAGVRVDQVARTNFVTDGYFDTFGIPLRQGRTFEPHELHGDSHAILVSESLARLMWPQQNAVGQTLAVNEGPWTQDYYRPLDAFRECQVIGVVGDVARFEDNNHNLVYLPMPLESPVGFRPFVRLRSETAAAPVAATAAAAARGIDLRFEERLTVRLQLGLAAYIILPLVSAILGGLALAMASVGLYGLISFGVNRRTAEIGIRMALGATTDRIVGLFVRQGMRLVMVGIALGLVGGVLCSQLLRAIVANIYRNPFDPVAFGTVTLLFVAITLFACWLPSRRAAKVDPAVALRAE